MHGFSAELCRDTQYIRMCGRRVGDPDGRASSKQGARPRFRCPTLANIPGEGPTCRPRIGSDDERGYEGGASDLYRLAQAMLKRHNCEDAIGVLEFSARIFRRDVLVTRHAR